MAVKPRKHRVNQIEGILDGVVAQGLVWGNGEPFQPPGVFNVAFNNDRILQQVNLGLVHVDPGPEPDIEDVGLQAYNVWSDAYNQFIRSFELRARPNPLHYLDPAAFDRAVYAWKVANNRQDAPQPFLDNPEFPRPDLGPAEFPQKPPQDVIKLRPRGEATPRFCLPYSSADEAKLRLGNTLVKIDDRVAYVRDVNSQIIDDRFPERPRGIGASVYFSDGFHSWIVLDYHDVDSRTLEPGYLHRKQNYSEYFIRIPVRIYKQGVCSDNSRLLDPASGHHNPFPGRNDNILGIMKAFEGRNSDLKFSKDLVESLITAYKVSGVPPSIRMSNKVAVLMRDKAAEKVTVLFKNFPCATFDSSKPDPEFKFDERFCSPGWIRSELESVGIT